MRVGAGLDAIENHARHTPDQMDLTGREMTVSPGVDQTLWQRTGSDFEGMPRILPRVGGIFIALLLLALLFWFWRVVR